MARIETYGRDTVVTGLDKVIGTDRESGKATKNYEMSAIRDFVLEGASPDVGGQLKITSVIQDTPIPGTESPEVLLNNLDPVLEINKYEILIVRLSFNDSSNEGKLTENVYLFNKVDVIVGFEEYESTLSDFILLSSKTETSEVVVDFSTLVSSVGNGSVPIYKGYNPDTESHEIRTVNQAFLGEQILYTTLNLNNEVSDTLAQKGLFSDDVLVTTEGGAIKFSTENISENIGEGVPVYKGYEGSFNNKHQFKTIKSSDNSVEINSLEDEVDIKVYNPAGVVGAFKTLNIGSGSVGDTFQVAGDISEAEITLIENSLETEVLITLSNPMVSSNYFVRVHFESLDASSTSDIERFSYKPITRDHTVNTFKVGFSKENITPSEQSYLVVLEVVQSFFVFDDEPVLADYQVAEGDCNNFDVNTATWNNVFIEDGFNLENGDIIYTDSLETIPFIGSANSVYRLRRNPSVGNPFLLDKQFTINNQGVVSELDSCGGFSILRLSVGGSNLSITGAEPNEEVTIEFSQCTSNQIGNSCSGNSFTLPPVNLGLGINVASNTFTVDSNGESTVNPYLWIDGGQGTGNVDVVVTARSIGTTIGQSRIINASSSS